MSKKGDDVKTLFAHRGLDPEDYRELSDSDESAEGRAADEDKWPHLGETDAASRQPAGGARLEPEQQSDNTPHSQPAQSTHAEPGPSVPPRLTDDDRDDPPADRVAPQYTDDDLIDDLLDDALAGQQPAPEQSTADSVPRSAPEAPPQAPTRDTAGPAAMESQFAQSGVEAGPERWSLLSSFDDMAGDTPEAQIDGLDDAEAQWPKTSDVAEQVAHSPEASEQAADETAPGFVAKAKRLFRSDEEVADDADRLARRERQQPPASETADDFWDEVAPQGQGDVDIDAVLARAEPADDAEAEIYAEPEVPAPRSATRPVSSDSALGGVMARLRAGPGPRPQAKPRLNLALDAPKREAVREEAPRDEDLASVLRRLKSTRRG